MEKRWSRRGWPGKSAVVLPWTQQKTESHQKGSIRHLTMTSAQWRRISLKISRLCWRQIRLHFQIRIKWWHQRKKERLRLSQKRIAYSPTRLQTCHWRRSCCNQVWLSWRNNNLKNREQHLHKENRETKAVLRDKEVNYIIKAVLNRTGSIALKLEGILELRILFLVMRRTTWAQRLPKRAQASSSKDNLSNVWLNQKDNLKFQPRPLCLANVDKVLIKLEIPVPKEIVCKGVIPDLLKEAKRLCAEVKIREWYRKKKLMTRHLHLITKTPASYNLPRKKRCQ